MRRVLGAGVLSLGLVLAAGVAEAAEPARAAGLNAEKPAVLLAAKKKKKKKKKAVEDDFGPEGVDAVDDNDTGVGKHREQEGVDVPYGTQLGGVTRLDYLTRKVGDASPSDELGFSIAGHLLFLLGSLGVGPEIEISYDTSSTEQDLGTEKKTIETTTQLIKLGGLARFFLGNVDTSLTLPFAEGGFAYQMGSTKVTDSPAYDQSGYEIKAGGGLALFLDSNVAIAPHGHYVINSLSGKPSGADKEVETSVSGLRVLLEFMIFL